MRPTRIRGSLVALLVAVTFAPRAQSQTAGDPRWQAWLGCWTAVQADTVAPLTAVCVIPARGTSAVDFVQIADIQVIGRNRIDADGAPHPSVRDGCTGWDRAEWSPDGWRLLLHAEHDCEGGEHRVTTGVMVMQGDGRWLSVLGANAAGHRSVQVQHYGMAPDDFALPEEVTIALGDSMAVWRVARAAEVPPVGTDEIIAANRQVDLFVLEAWLAEAAGPVRFNGRQLVQLANGGVQPSTIDVLVGLANPGVFRVAAQPPAPEQIGGAGSRVTAFAPVGYGFVATSPMMDADSMLRCQAVNAMWMTPSADYRYARGYCGSYAYGRGYGWYDSQPTVQTMAQVTAGGAAGAAPSGRAVNGRGYTQGSGTRPPADAPHGSTDGQAAGEAGTREAAGATPGGYGTGSPTSTPTERTAIPRP